MLVDIARYFLHYLPQILLTLPCIYWATREIRTERQWGGIFWITGIAGLVVAGVLLLSSIPLATGHGWSGARLAPATGWVRGYHLFYPANEGPILVQMYGPVSAIVYLPAVWISQRPTTAIILGTLTNALLYIAPAIWFIRRGLAGSSKWIQIVAIAIFLLLSCRQFVLYEAATRVTIDAPALAFAVLAMTSIIGLRQNHFKHGLICGGLVALSIWTKLTFIPLLGAVAIYVILISDIRSAADFIGGLSIAVIGLTGFFLICFGPALILQNVTVPMRQPWQWPGLSRGEAYLRALHWVWRYSAFAFGTLMFAIVLASLNVQNRLRWKERKVWARATPWLLPMLSAVLIFPTATLAYVKVGGSWNNAAASSYLAILAAAVAMGQACGRSITNADEAQQLPLSVRFSRTIVVLLLIFTGWFAGGELAIVRNGLHAWSHLSDNPHEEAFTYTRQHPGDVYFPNYPLSMLLAEGKLYHFDAGIESAEWGGIAVDSERLWKGLPPYLHKIYFRAGERSPTLIERFPNFKLAPAEPGMEGWMLYKREDDEAKP